MWPILLILFLLKHNDFLGFRLDSLSVCRPLLKILLQLNLAWENLGSTSWSRCEFILFCIVWVATGYTFASVGRKHRSMLRSAWHGRFSSVVAFLALVAPMRSSLRGPDVFQAFNLFELRGWWSLGFIKLSHALFGRFLLLVLYLVLLQEVKIAEVLSLCLIDYSLLRFLCSQLKN